MTDDIVARLRDGEPDRCHGCSEWVCDGELSREEMGGADCDCDCHRWAHLVREAADEIERLRKKCDGLQPFGEWLTVDGLCNHDASDYCGRKDHVRHQMFVKWTEADRG